MTIAGRSIVVCRATHQAMPLLEGLANLGAVAIHVPLIEVLPPLDGGAELGRAIGRSDGSTWFAFTSANGVDAVARVLDGSAPSGRIGVVGGATAERARLLGWEIDAVSVASSAAGLGASLPAVAGDRVIAPLAELAGPDLAVALEHRGITVETVTAYRTSMPDVSTEDLGRIRRGDAILVTAPSVVQRLAAVMGSAALPPLIAIGPTSAAAIEAAGWPVAGQATESSVDGLIAAVVRTLGS